MLAFTFRQAPFPPKKVRLFGGPPFAIHMLVHSFFAQIFVKNKKGERKREWKRKMTRNGRGMEEARKGERERIGKQERVYLWSEAPV